MVQVELAIFFAIHSLVAFWRKLRQSNIQLLLLFCSCSFLFRTFFLAVLTHIRESLWTFSSGMAFLVADAARALKNARLSALGLGMAGTFQYHISNKELYFRLFDLPFFTTIEARHRLARLGAVAREMTLVTAAKYL